MGSLVVVGDALLDRDVEGVVSRISPDAPVPVLDAVDSRCRPGGAALAAVLAAADGVPVTLVCRLAEDPAGAELRRLLERAGVSVIAGPSATSTPEKVRFLAADRVLLRVDHGGQVGSEPPLPESAHRVVSEAAAVLVSDYGRGVADDRGVRQRLGARRRPTVWDPHPLGGDPVPGATVVTPNQAEVARLLGPAPDSPQDQFASVIAAGAALRTRWRVGSLAVTMGAQGAVLVDGTGPPVVVPARPAAGDPCGAGDRFAARVATQMMGGAILSEAVTSAVHEATSFVAAGGARAWRLPGRPGAPGGPASSPVPGAAALARRVRADGRRLVVAGGCFDILHAGHISLLESARRLGDCLIVALNSDASVRRIKGPGRPVTGQDDRASMLSALECVDGVAIFDEDSPEEVLRVLRPHLFVKGGDYSTGRLPEEDVLAEWGGQAVVLPYLSGRSTTGILQRAGAS